MKKADIRNYPEKEKVETEQEQEYRKRKAKFRFRAIVRLALANAYWLTDYSHEKYDGTTSTKKMIQIELSKRKSQLTSLTLQDKALLYKSPNDRTPEEKHRIFRIISRLGFFSKYPAKVQRKLTGRTYYRYYGPKRVIFRQNHPPQAMYCIISGNVIMTKKVFDDFLHSYSDEEVSILGPGDMVGEKTLLHEIPRLFTCTTLGHTELLMLLEQDFKMVLKETIKKEWEDVKAAMNMFTYFHKFDEALFRDACFVAKIKHYKRNDTLVGDLAGTDHLVYFLLDGRCALIEHMVIKIITRHDGKKFYQLIDVTSPENPEEHPEDIFAKYMIQRQEKSRYSLHSAKSAISQKSFSLSERAQSFIIQSNKGKKEIENSNSSIHDVDNNKDDDNNVVSTPNAKQLRRLSKVSKKDSKTNESSVSKKVPSITEKSASLPTRRVSTAKKKTPLDKVVTIREEAFIHVNENDSMHDSEIFSVSSGSEDSNAPILQTYFMQVCEYLPKATFNLGERMQNRRVVVISDEVKCLVIPRLWLMQHNPINIWNRVLHFLKRKLPTKTELFEMFLRDRQWDEYRDMLVEDVVKKSHVLNFTTKHDVPYSVRMDDVKESEPHKYKF